MKDIIPAAVIALGFGLCLWLMGCGPSQVTKPEVYSNLKQVVHRTGCLDIYVVEIDGKEYVIVQSVGAGIAVCPKTQ